MSGTTKQPSSWGNMEKIVVMLGTLAWIPAIASAALGIGLYTYVLTNWLYVHRSIISLYPSYYTSAVYISMFVTWGWFIGAGVVELILTFVYVLKTFVPKCKAKDWQFLATEPSFGPKVPKMLLFAILLEVFSWNFFGGVLVIVVMILIYTQAPVTNPWKATTGQPAASTLTSTTAQQPVQKPAATAQQPAIAAEISQPPARNVEVARKQVVAPATAAAVPGASAPSRTMSEPSLAGQGPQNLSGTKMREVPLARLFDGTNTAGISGKIVLMNDGVVFTTGKKQTFTYHVNDIAKVSPGAKTSIFDIEMKNGDKRSFKLLGAQEWASLLNNQILVNSGSSKQITQNVVKQQKLQPQPGATPSNQEIDAKQRADAVEAARMEKLKKLVKVSEKLRVSQMAQILNMNETALYDRIVDWAAEYGFTLDEDVVKFSGGRKDDFINSLGGAFSDWGEKTVSNEEKHE